MCVANVITMKLESVMRQPVLILDIGVAVRQLQHEVQVEGGSGAGHWHYVDDELILIADTICTWFTKDIFF